MFLWDGKEMATYGDIAGAMEAIRRSTDEVSGRRQNLADEFMRAYRADNDHADANVGYLCGYYGSDTMSEMLRLFRVAHPVFGCPTEAANVTPEQAVEMGKDWAEQGA